MLILENLFLVIKICTMKLERFEMDSIFATGALMAETVAKYHEDVSFLDDESLEYCFHYVASLPYIPDPEDGEYLSRPKASLSPNAKFRDCDDKAIILGCCLYRREIPFYFIAVSENKNKDIHHVLIELAKPEKDKTLQGFNKKVRFLDATYPENEYGLVKKFYKKVRI